MPVVLIHGVPDTTEVWDSLRGELSRKDVLALKLPGFDDVVPPGFTCTKEEYVNFIAERLEELDSPADLVGHDWGCLLTARVASTRPELVRSWAAGDGPLDACYDWHPLAKIWQTPGEGERWMEEVKPSELVKPLTEEGLLLEVARRTAERLDRRMKATILNLYRSAKEVGSEWQPELRNIRSPGLVFWGARDKACPVQFSETLAADTRAIQTVILDAGHWSIVERSKELAAALEEFWSNLS